MPVLYPRYRHSVSSANLWRECPSAFLWRYGLQKWGKDNARTWMGKAAEKAYANALLNGLTPDEVEADGKQRFYNLSEGEDSEHAEYSGAIARLFLESTAPEWGKLIQHEPWRPVTLMPLNREISFKPDFVFENALVDTKATLRMPSEPSPNHVRQISAYSREWDLPGVLFYATPKKSAHFTIDVDDAEAACRTLVRDWRQIEAWDASFPDVRAAARVTPLNTDSFYWDEEEVEAAHTLWNEALMKEEV